MVRLAGAPADTRVPAWNSPAPRTKCLTRWRTSTSAMTIVQITLRRLLRADGEVGRRHSSAGLEAIGTARVVRAAGRQRHQQRNGALDRVQPLARTAAGDRSEQS